MIKIRNFFKAIVCITCLTVFMNNANTQPWPPAGMIGNGSSGNPYQITTITQLANLALYVNAGNGSQTAGKYYKLMNDVDYKNSSPNQSVLGWDPIGNNLGYNTCFQGNFDGNGKVVANIRSNRASWDFIGLFGYFVRKYS